MADLTRRALLGFGAAAALAAVAGGPVIAATTNPSNGTGGALADRMGVRFNNGKVVSHYHLYAAHLTGPGPHGIMLALHGDHGSRGTPYWYNSPNDSTVRALRDLARQHNMLFVVPRTPDRSGNQTWWEGTNSEQWAVALYGMLCRRYNVDRDKVWWVGYSGGSDGISESIMQTYSNRWTGGGAVLMCGGGGWAPLRTPISADIKRKFQMHWVVGSEDTAGKNGMGSDGFDALAACRRGEARFRGLGLQTSLTVVPGKTHNNIGPDGIVKLREVLK